MKKKNGFTLVELLSVIVILGIVATIGIMSYGSIKTKTLEKQYENLELKIVTAGKKYLSQREINEVYVQTLIDEGLLTAQSKGFIFNPVNNEVLNCYYVKNDETKLTKGDCTPGNIDDGQISILYSTDNNNFKEYNDLSSEWIKSDVIYFKVNFTGHSINSISWTSLYNPNKATSSEVYKIDVGSIGYLNTQASVFITDEKGKNYTKSFNIKLDYKKPTVNKVTINDLENITESKTVDIEVCDKESGLSSVYIYDSNKQELFNKTSINKACDKITNTFTKNGIYYILAKDILGNSIDLEDKKEFEVTNIDTQKPEISVNVINNDLEVDKITLEFKCTDDLEVKSYAVKRNDIETWKTPDTKTNDFSLNITLTTPEEFTVKCKDASNISEKTFKIDAVIASPLTSNACHNNSDLFPLLKTYLAYRGSTVNLPSISSENYDCIWHDNNNNKDITTNQITVENNISLTPKCTYNGKPSIKSVTISSLNEDYNTKDVNIKVETNSNIPVSKICILKDTSDVSKCSWNNVTGSSYTNNSYSVSSTYNGVQHSLYFYVKDCDGNISEKVGKIYRVYKEFDETEIVYGACSKSCYQEGKTLPTKTKKILDKYTRAQQAGDTVYCSITEDNLPECCSKTTKMSNGSGVSECSASCGGGTKDTFNFYIDVSSYDSNIICSNEYRETTSTTACNTQACTTTINDLRYDGCDTYYITTCDSTNCKYTKKNNAVSSGSIAKTKLSTKYNCTAPEKYCNAYIDSNLTTTNSVRFFVGTSPDDLNSTYCKMTSYVIDTCSDPNNKGYNYFYSGYSSLSVGTRCRYEVNSISAKGTTVKDSWYTTKCSDTRFCSCEGSTTNDRCRSNCEACAYKH